MNDEWNSMKHVNGLDMNAVKGTYDSKIVFIFNICKFSLVNWATT